MLLRSLPWQNVGIEKLDFRNSDFRNADCGLRKGKFSGSLKLGFRNADCGRGSFSGVGSWECGLRKDAVADCGKMRLRVAERHDCGLQIVERRDCGLRKDAMRVVDCGKMPCGLWIAMVDCGSKSSAAVCGFGSNRRKKK